MRDPIEKTGAVATKSVKAGAPSDGLVERPAGLWHHARAVALITLAVTGLFWRVFFFGETLVDVATLDNQLPWGYYAGQASDYPYNRRDLTDMYVTRDYFVVASYRDGELPLWNPFTMAGHPIYADGVTRIASPFLLLYAFLDVPLGYTVARITELLLAAIFMYIFLVAIGVSARGSLAASLVFALSAHSMLHLTGLGWWGGLMWLPLIFLFADRAVTRNSYAQAILAGVFLGVQFFCGYLPTQVYYPAAVIMYYLFFASRFGRRLSLRRAAVMIALTVGVGFALGATQWLPMLELLKHSNRRIVGAELGYVYLPPWYAATLIFPNLFGAAYDAKALTLFTALGVSHDHILYLGMPALLALGVSIFRLKKLSDDVARRRILFFALLAGLALVLMMCAPVYVRVTRFIPLMQVIRVAVRAGVLFLFAACVLVGYGVDLLLESNRESLSRLSRVARKFFFAAVGFVLACVVASYALRLSGFAVDPGGRGRMAFLRRAASLLTEQFTPPAASILIPLALLAAVWLLVKLTASEIVSRRAFFAALIVLLVTDLYWSGAQFNSTFDRQRVFPRTKITDLLRSLPPGRVLVTPSDIDTNRRVSSDSGREKIIAPPNTLLAYGIATVTGKNQQFPKWYKEYAAVIEPQPNMSHVVFETSRSPLFDLLNVRYVMTHASAPRLSGYELLTTDEGIALYKNDAALPRAFFAGRLIPARSHDEAIKAIADPGFDPRTTAVIEADAPGPQVLDGEAKAAIVYDGRNRVVIETESKANGVLVLSDNYYPGWQVLVDGSPADVLRANCTMRAVAVSAGSHVVSFTFRPPMLRASAYVSVLAALFVPAALATLEVRKRRRAAREET